MTGIKNYLPQNIKSLRMAYGESQMELAFAIGLDALAAISNYEKGTRSPKPDVRRKIAEHFRITEEQLIHVDLSGVHKISFEYLNDAARIQEITFAAFPVVCSDSALKNSIFADGYSAHMRIKKCLLSGKEPNEKDYDICFDSYDKAFEEYALPEAAANMLWWLVQLEYIVLNQKITEGAQQLIKNKISGVEFLRKSYLRSFGFEGEDDTDDDSEKRENMQFYNDIEEIVQDYLKALRSSHLFDLAYYYVAIKYAFGIVKNELSQEMNQAIGYELLWAVSELGNKYAKAYLQAVTSATK